MDIILAVKEFGTNKTIKEILCKSMHQAEKAQNGLDRQLNHDLYYSEIETDTSIQLEDFTLPPVNLPVIGRAK